MNEYKKEEYWSRFAGTFNDDQTYIVGAAVQQAIMERLSGESDLGELIELGCGTGFYTKVLAENASHVTATDLSDEMLAVARSQLTDYQNVTVEKADCEKTAFPDGRFGSVFMANLVHVIENPSIVLRESHRILKDGGVLLVVSYTSYGMKFFKKAILGLRFLMKWGKPPSSFHGYSPDELRSLAESAGFEVEEVQIIGNESKGLYLKGRKR